MGCGCGGQKLPPGNAQQVAAGAKPKPSNPFPPSYFWNGPQPKK